MANHRLSTPAPSWLQLLSPTYLRRLSTPRRRGLIADLIVGAALIPSIAFLFTHSVGLVVGLVAAAFIRVSLNAVFAGRQQALDDRIEARNLDMLESLAAHPGGAPLIADVRSHCGCVLRYHYDGQLSTGMDALWAPVAVIEADQTCLAEAR